MVDRAVINTRDIKLGSVSTGSVHYNTDYTLCKNTKPTSTEVKCSMSSSLDGLKAIKSISLHTPNNLNNYNTEINLKIDYDYLINSNYLPGTHDKLAHLEGEVMWRVSNNYVVEYDLVSINVPPLHKVEAIIPPASCFNLTLKESITELSVPFTLYGNLRSADNFNVISEDISLAGEMKINILDTEYSEAMPCI